MSGRQRHRLAQDGPQAGARRQIGAQRIAQAGRHRRVQAAVAVAVERAVVARAQAQLAGAVAHARVDLAVVGVDRLGLHQHRPADLGAGARAAARRDGRRAVHADAEQARAFLVFSAQCDVELPARVDDLRIADTQPGALDLQLVGAAGLQRVVAHPLPVLGPQLPVALLLPAQVELARFAQQVDALEADDAGAVGVAALVVQTQQDGAAAIAQAVVLAEQAALGPPAVDQAEAQVQRGVGAGALSTGTAAGGQHRQRDEAEEGFACGPVHFVPPTLSGT